MFFFFLYSRMSNVKKKYSGPVNNYCSGCVHFIKHRICRLSYIRIVFYVKNFIFQQTSLAENAWRHYDIKLWRRKNIKNEILTQLKIHNSLGAREFVNVYNFSYPWWVGRQSYHIMYSYSQVRPFVCFSRLIDLTWTCKNVPTDILDCQNVCLEEDCFDWLDYFVCYNIQLHDTSTMYVCV